MKSDKLTPGFSGSSCMMFFGEVLSNTWKFLKKNTRKSTLSTIFVTRIQGIKKPGFITSIWYLGEERPGLHCKYTDFMEYNKSYFEKVFSTKRMERYFRLHNDEKRAITHYQSNIELAESFYPCVSILEVALRNAISRELETMTGREDWYAISQPLLDLITSTVISLKPASRLLADTKP